MLVIGCTVSGSAMDSALPRTGVAQPATTPDDDRPIDKSIAPVSMSKPSDEAQRALDLCNIREPEFKKHVAGMGLVARARDLPEYADLVGVEPGIQSDEPAWLIQYSGDREMLFDDEVWVDPICVVTADEPGWYATGGATTKDGTFLAPIPPKSPPVLRVPPLAP